MMSQRMSVKAIQAAIARLVQPISSAPRDGSVIFVFLPEWRLKRLHHKAMWVRTRWVEDHRDDRCERRHDLMMKHGGYWAKVRATSTKPLHCHPTHWLPELPILEPHTYQEAIDG